MKRIEKRYISILELLIALSLTAVLLSALLGYYQQASYAQTVIHKNQEKNFELLYAQYRLNRIIPATMNPLDDKELLGVYFFTKPASSAKEKSESLIFTYDNGTGAGSLFSNEVLGKLFVDNNNQLILLTWPVIDRFEDPEPPVRKEVLLTNVTELSFKFYKSIPMDKKGLDIDPDVKRGNYNVWLSQWSIEDKELPALIKINVKIKNKEEPIKDKEEPIVYAFVLSNSLEHIFYP